jgi:DNA-binding MurR/RpiR family transcriptional regulator
MLYYFQYFVKRRNNRMSFPNQIEDQANSLARIRSMLPTMAAAERKVAAWVIQHSDEMIRLSMAQLGQLCGVSDTTVLRFCRAAGFQGYTDLKLAIACDLTSPTVHIHDEISKSDDSATIARKVFTSHIQALSDTSEVLNPETFERAVDLLARANRILFIGVGTSGPFVQDLYNKFFRLGFICSAQTDSYLQLMEAAMLKPGDLTVGISYSGLSIDPALTLEYAQRNGISTICITGNAQSPITKHADITLLTVSHETRAETIVSRVAQHAMTDALYVAVSLRMIDIAVENEKLIWDAVMPKAV